MLEKIKDFFTIAGTVIAVLSLIFSAWQFYLSRLAVQSQTVTSASALTFQIQSQILASPDRYASIYGLDKDALLADVAVRQILSSFVVLYYAHAKRTLPDDAWDPIEQEICEFSKGSRVAPTIHAAIDQMQYPRGFLRMLANCS